MLFSILYGHKNVSLAGKGIIIQVERGKGLHLVTYFTVREFCCQLASPIEYSLVVVPPNLIHCFKCGAMGQADTQFVKSGIHL